MDNPNKNPLRNMATQTTELELGKILRKARESKGMSLAKVEKLTGIYANNICYIENGQRGITGKTLLRLCEVYDVDVVLTPTKTR